MTWRELITKIGFDVSTSSLTAYDKAIDEVYRKTENMYRGLNKLADSMVSIGTKMSLGLTLPMAAIGTVSVMASAKIEQVRVSYRVLLGDAQKADALLRELFKFEAETPFNLEQVMDFSNQLLLAKIPAQDLTHWMTLLGDATMGNAQGMDRVIYQFAQIQNRGYAMTDELNRFAEALVPMRDELKKMLGVEGAGLEKMLATHKITPEIIMQAFENIGARRKGLMDQQSKTISGLLSTISSGIFKLRLELGDLLVKELHIKGVLTRIITGLNWITDKIHKMPQGIKRLILIVGAFVFAIGPLILSLGLLLKLGLGLKLAFTGLRLLGLAGGLSSLLPLLGKIALTLAAITFQMVLWGAAAALIYLVFDDIWGYFHGKDSFLIPEWKKIFTEFFDWYQSWGDTLYGWWKTGVDSIVAYWTERWTSFMHWYENLAVVKFFMKVGSTMAAQQREVRAFYGDPFNLNPPNYDYMQKKADTTPVQAPQINVNVGSLSVPVTGGMGVPWRSELIQNATPVIQQGIVDQISEALKNQIDYVTRR